MNCEIEQGEGSSIASSETCSTASRPLSFAEMVQQNKNIAFTNVCPKPTTVYRTTSIKRRNKKPAEVIPEEEDPNCK